MEQNSEKLSRIKRYEIVRTIGEGGMGRVYLAMDKIIRRPVAIKVFSLDDLVGPDMPRERVMRDFFIETQTAGALLHPNIVVIYDVGKKADLLYMVMELVYGKTLLHHQRRAAFSIRKALELVYELALALDYAHSKGVVHRDIKPENIIISSQGVPKITDFGIARFRKHLKKQRQVLMGSSRFIAPEQIQRKQQDHRVDIYQLGVVLFELLTGQTPFKGVTPQATLTKICTETAPPPSRINPEISLEVDGIVARCLEKNPWNRFPTAKELADALAESLRSGIHTGLLPDKELVDSLKKFELFAHFTEPEIIEVANAGEFITCKANDYIIRENETDSNFFVLLNGNVKVVKRSRVLSNFLPGAVFGEIGAFARQKRSAGVIASEDCRLLRINALLFKQLDPLLQLKMLHIVVRNLATLIMSLDTELMHLAEGEPQEAPTMCPLCGFDNKAPIEVCPRCGVIPDSYSELTQTVELPPPPEEKPGPKGDSHQEESPTAGE